MKKIKVSFDVWIQFLGMLGVLGGLVFVGLEMRQSQQLALAAQQTARMQVWTDMVNSFTKKLYPSIETNLNIFHFLFNLSIIVFFQSTGCILSVKPSSSHLS